MPQAMAALLELGGLGVGDAGEDDEDAVGAERARISTTCQGS